MGKITTAEALAEGPVNLGKDVLLMNLEFPRQRAAPNRGHLK